jgi:hypothetical protein
VAAKGYARRRAANVNGLTFRRISDPDFVPDTESPAASLDDFVGRGGIVKFTSGHTGSSFWRMSRSLTGGRMSWNTKE